MAFPVSQPTVDDHPPAPCPARREPEVHLFLVWAFALPSFDRILRDVTATFTVLDVLEVEWTRGRFAENLSRFYDHRLPPNSQKEQHCGTGPFRIIVVEDASPEYGLRRGSRGKALVNTKTFDAKKRYRDWTGGGHRIHASVTPEEARHDLVLLLGREPEEFQGKRGWDGTVPSLRQDVVGVNGWRSLRELLTAFDVTCEYAVLPAVDAEDGAEKRPLRLLVEHFWYPLLLFTGHPPAKGHRKAVHDVPIGGVPTTVVLSEVGDGSLERWWQEAILARRGRDETGAFVPAPADRTAILLRGALADDRCAALSDELAADLLRLGRLEGLELPEDAPPERVLEGYLAALHAGGWHRPRAPRWRTVVERGVALVPLQRLAGAVRSRV